jgi:hypothetical protein
MIRPLDLQNTILQSIQSAPAVQRADEGSRLSAQAAQSAFAADLTHREESVAAATEATGNRIGAKPEERRERGSGGKKRTPRSSFEQVVDDAAEVAGEPAHLIDFSA